jgi:hypothetical protein
MNRINLARRHAPRANIGKQQKQTDGFLNSLHRVNDDSVQLIEITKGLGDALGDSLGGLE